MNTHLAARLHVPIILMASLLMGFLLQSQPGWVPGAQAEPTAAPFQTLDKTWLVRVRFHAAAPPEIVNVSQVDEGRISVLETGADKIQLVAGNGEILYEQAFHVSFLVSELSEPAEQVTLFFSLPAVQGAALIRVQTSQGEDTYELPR